MRVSFWGSEEPPKGSEQRSHALSCAVRELSRQKPVDRGGEAAASSYRPRSPGSIVDQAGHLPPGWAQQKRAESAGHRDGGQGF